MSFCCPSPLSIGCFKSCGPIYTGLYAPAAGTYNLHLYAFSGLEIINFVDMSLNQEFIIDDVALNEHMIYKFKIYDENGELVSFEDNTCFKFETFLANGSDATGAGCGDPDCPLGKELAAASFIHSLTGATHGNDGHLDLTMVRTYDDQEDILGPEVWTVNWGDPVLGLSDISSGSASAHMTGVSSGIKTGTVNGPGCYMQFAYRVQSQKVVWFTSTVNRAVEPTDYACGETKQQGIETGTTVTYTDFGRALEPTEPALISLTALRSAPVDIVENGWQDVHSPEINTVSKNETLQLKNALTLLPVNIIYAASLVGGSIQILSDNKLIFKCKTS